MKTGAAAVLLLAAGTGFAQPGAKLEFEVAAVKPLDPDKPGGAAFTKGGPGTADPGLIRYHNSLFWLFIQAYGVRPYQIAGPDWMRNLWFDISAKAPPGATVEQVNVMLQNLLLSRFGVAAHHEMRNFPAYNLSVAKSGSKLLPTAYPNAAAKAPSSVDFSLDKNDFPVLPKDLNAQARVTWIKNGSFRSTFRAFSTARLAEEVQAALPDFMSSEYMKSAVSVPPRVFDRTGLTGQYDFTLEYEGRGDDASGPSIFTALEKQLGLKLDKIEWPEDVMVIDRINKTPEEN